MAHPDLIIDALTMPRPAARENAPTRRATGWVPQGRTLTDERVMASCGTGCWGTFDVTIRYAVGKAGWGTLRVFEPSAQDGSPENTTESPVWLTP